MTVVATPAMQTKTQQRTVLIVDDQPMNVKLLEQVLLADDMEVITATSGSACLEIASHVRPDLILLDIMMPKMDGFETCRKLQEDPVTRGIPVIFVTAKNGKKDKLQGLGVGAVDYVTKPIDADEVLARVKTQLAFIDTHQLNMELQKRLQESRRSATIGAVTEGISHNLNNILAGSMGYLDIIATDPRNAERVEKSVDAAKGSLKRIIKIVEQLSHISDKEPIIFSGARLSDLWEEAFEGFASKHKNVMECLEVYNEMPPETELETNCEIFETVLYHLLQNAWESYGADTSQDERPIRLVFSSGMLEDGEAALVITVEDSGQGIPESLQETFQEPFVSGHAQIGKGLGLTIARNAVLNLKGSLTVSNRSEGGVRAVWVHPIRQ